jgi:hypothetical protein
MHPTLVCEWIETVRNYCLGHPFTIPTQDSRRAGRVIATKPGAILVAYTV